MTSVTNKIRRVGLFDWDLARSAVRVNRPTRVAINGLDYLDFANYGIKRVKFISQTAGKFICELEKELSGAIQYLGVGPSLDQIIDCGGCEEPAKGQSSEVIMSR